MYILKKEGLVYSIMQERQEALSLETMMRMSLMTERLGRMNRTPFPRGLSAEIAIIPVNEMMIFLTAGYFQLEDLKA